MNTGKRNERTAIGCTVLIGIGLIVGFSKVFTSPGIQESHSYNHQSQSVSSPISTRATPSPSLGQSSLPVAATFHSRAPSPVPPTPDSSSVNAKIERLLNSHGEFAKADKIRAKVDARFPEQVRKVIYREARTADRKADADVQADLPDGDNGENVTRDYLKKQLDYRDARSAHYVADVSRRYNLTEKEMDAVWNEGLEHNWPYPGFDPPASKD